MVAPSFKNFEFLTEPYFSNGKQYIKVRNPKTGTERQVRWYEDAEYRKLYPEEQKIFKTRKQVLGFDNDYITIARSYNEEAETWLETSSARFHTYWGWYFISSEPLPSNIPKNIKLYVLPWSSVSTGENLLSENIVKKNIMEIIKNV